MLRVRASTVLCGRNAACSVMCWHLPCMPWQGELTQRAVRPCTIIHLGTSNSMQWCRKEIRLWGHACTAYAERDMLPVTPMQAAHAQFEATLALSSALLHQPRLCPVAAEQTHSFTLQVMPAVTQGHI